MFRKTGIPAVLAMAVLFLSAGNTVAEVREDLDTFQEETNAGMGVLSSRIAALESKAKISVKGDVRARHEVFNQKANMTDGPKRTNNRGRSRIRARLSASKQVSDEVFGAIGLATGSLTDPTSTNQTLDANFTEKGVYIDYGYVTWSPSALGNRVMLTGGKMLNPLAKSAINWDGDTNPEGWAGELNLDSKSKFRGGWFVLKENSSGKEWGMNVFQLERALALAGFDVKAAAGYQFVPFTNKLAGGTPDPLKTGNIKNTQGVIPDFKGVDGLLQFKRKVSGHDLVLLLHVCHNMNSFDLPTVGTAENDNENAYLAEVNYGKVAAKGDKSIGLRWAYLQPNSVLSIFPDSDAEYTNRKYLRATFGYGIADGMQFDLTGFGIRRVTYDVFTGSNRESRETLYRTQIDFVVKI